MEAFPMAMTGRFGGSRQQPRTSGTKRFPGPVKCEAMSRARGAMRGGFSACVNQP